MQFYFQFFFVILLRPHQRVFPSQTCGCGCTFKKMRMFESCFTRYDTSPAKVNGILFVLKNLTRFFSCFIQQNFVLFSPNRILSCFLQQDFVLISPTEFCPVFSNRILSLFLQQNFVLISQTGFGPVSSLIMFSPEIQFCKLMWCRVQILKRII